MVPYRRLMRFIINFDRDDNRDDGSSVMVLNMIMIEMIKEMMMWLAM